MSFPLLNLPTDLIREMMIRYFDPQDAFTCLRVCKRLYSISEPYSIVERFLKYRSVKYYHLDVSNLSICSKCNVCFPNKSSLANHMKKHLQFEKSGKKMMPKGKQFVESKCSRCNLPVNNVSGHWCFHKRSCFNGHHIEFYEWAESLCKRHSWFTDDPQKFSHGCRARCKACHEEFDSEPAEASLDSKNGFATHFQSCSQKEKIIQIYKLYEHDNTNHDEQKQKEFEQDYLEWKKINSK